MKENGKRRIAAYCRVSTDQEDQIHSLENQKQYFLSYIGQNTDWELIKIYADEGISGTNIKKRTAFRQMIKDAERGNFDLVLTKEISRFARNTLDSIFYVRKLKERGIGVIFMNENINTLDSDAELRLTIFSSIAQEESRKTSERVKWGQTRRMEQGVVFGRSMIGYDVKDGKISLNEEGARTVRFIYHKFLHEGKGCHSIAKELENAGIRTVSGNRAWSGNMVLKLLRNEKYCGDLVQKKTITPDYLTHQKKYNHGEEPMIIIRDHHPPIVSREEFDAVQKILTQRSDGRSSKGYSNRYCFSGKIQCGMCLSQYISRVKRRKDGTMRQSWKCYRAHTNGTCEPSGCQNRLVQDRELRECLTEIMKRLSVPVAVLTRRIEKRIKQLDLLDIDPNFDKKNIMAKLEEQRTRLIDLYLEGDLSLHEFQKRKESLEEEYRCIEMKRDMLPEKAEIDLVCYIRSRISGEEWDDVFYRHILDHVTVNEKHLTITFCELDAVWNCIRKTPV